MHKLGFITKDSNAYKSVFSSEDISLLESQFRIIGYYDKKTQFDTIIEVTKDINIIVSTWDMISFTKEEIRRYFPNLESVFYAGGTVDYFAKPFLDLGITVHNATRLNGRFVAEYLLGLILIQTKSFLNAQKAYKSILYGISYKKALRYVSATGGNYDKTIGLIGLGNVGSQLLCLLQPFFTKILVCDPYISHEDFRDMKYEMTTMENLFKQSDIISNNLPDKKSTQNIIDYNLIYLMKTNVTFINAGRQNQVDYKALASFMKKNKMATAIIDVFSHEPIYPWVRLLRVHNAFLTPHIAGAIYNERYAIGNDITKQLLKEYGKI